MFLGINDFRVKHTKTGVVMQRRMSRQFENQ